MAIDKVVSASITDSAVTDAKLSFNSNQFRNIIINGDMSQAQRATSTSSITGNGYHTIDRFKTIITSQGTWTQSQSTTVPTGQGFAKSLKMDCTTADASPAAGDRIFIFQKIEGQNLQYLKKGTSSAESLTLSFWVRSNKTGTYIAEIQDEDNSRSNSQSYTISSADTWEKKTITYDGDTTGTLDNDNASSLVINFWLGGGSTYTGGTLNTSWGSEVTANRAVGQVNLADSTSNEWYITGIQLEAGTSASDFEFLPVDVNENRCLRYFYQIISKSDTDSINAYGYYYSASNIKFPIRLPTQMRSVPTLEQSIATNALRFYRDSTYDGQSANFALDGNGSGRYVSMYNSTDASGTAGQAGHLYKYSPTQADSYIWLDAEL